MFAKLMAPERGFWVLFSFIAFFGVIVAVNSVFITQALSTHSGVITEKPYEKGLEFDAMVEAAKAQPQLSQEFSYADGILRWDLRDENGVALRGADVTARLVWPVKSGYDMDVTLFETAPGIYEVQANLPRKGRWKTTLKATWNEQTYQTRASFISR